VTADPRDSRDSPEPVSGIDEWAELALTALAGLPDVLRVGVALTEGGGRRLLFTASDRRRDGTTHDWCHVDAFSVVPLNDAIRSVTTVAGSLGALDPRYDEYVRAQRGTGFTDVATVPFIGEEAPLGGFVVYYGAPQAFDAGQLAALEEVASRLTRGLGQALRQDPRPPQPDPVAAAGSFVAERAIPADVAAVAEARRFLRRTLIGWKVDEDVADDAVLCLSELVTNAVIHTTGGCHVQVELHGGVLTSRVHDNGSVVTPAVVASHDEVQGHGHGLRVVEALSTRWGRSSDPAEAWFELEVS
jgi:anti-sigma regulatory factor (Ser/Thr protein kinase)